MACQIEDIPAVMGKFEHRSSHFKTRRRRGSHLTVTGKFPSPKNPHCLFFEGFRERDLMVFLSYDPSVSRVDDHPQPPIRYRDGKKWRTYTSDALVRFQQGAEESVVRRPLMIEVKLKAEVERNAAVLGKKFEAVAAQCGTEARDFAVVTEETLARPMVRSLRFLFRYRQHRPDAELLARIDAAVPKDEVISLRRLIDKVSCDKFPEGKVIAATWHLVASRRISVNLDAPLSVNSLLQNVEWRTSI